MSLDEWHRTIFSSVFTSPTHTVPTPETTPNIGVLASPGTPFGGFNTAAGAADEAVKLNRAWSTATRYLTNAWALEEVERRDETAEVLQALTLLLRDHASKRKLLDWCIREITEDLRQQVFPDLAFWQRPIASSEASDVLARTVGILQSCQSRYLGAFDMNTRVVRSRKGANLDDFAVQLKLAIHTVVIHALPRQRLQNTLASCLFQIMSLQMKNTRHLEKCLKDKVCSCQLEFDYHALGEVQNVGLGGAIGERALAFAVHKLLQGPAVERRCFQVDWIECESVAPKVRTWTVSHFTPAITMVLETLTKSTISPDSRSDSSLLFTSAAVAGLGRLRIGSLFEYIKSWPASKGAILDIREYLAANGPAEKAALCADFSDQVQRRLLHAGATTNEIISVFINVINAFKQLDSRGVLLEKVIISIRNYLRAREDTVHIVAASLLAEIDDEGNVNYHDRESVCREVIAYVSHSMLAPTDVVVLNWNDMSWTPDPIDAAPQLGPLSKSSKPDDVVAYILALFEPDDFIAAATSALSKQLLRSSNRELVMETRLVELLKTRLDQTKLQAAEVMLQDVRQSAHLNRLVNIAPPAPKPTGTPTPRDIQLAIPSDGITLGSLYSIFEGKIKRSQFQATLKLIATRRNDLYYPKRARLPSEEGHGVAHSETENPEMDVKVISGYFWPQLRDTQFKIPDNLSQLQDTYEKGFANISGQRKLAWCPAEGTMDLLLEFEDRTVEEMGVAAWKSSVLDAFSQSNEYDESVGLGVSDLMESLNMSEEYVHDALTFWVSKQVLYPVSPGHYTVLERLDMAIKLASDENDDVDMTTLDDEGLSLVRAEDAKLRESAPVFQTFIANMLRNTGAKEIEGFMGITNMLKMVLPIFTYGDDEVKLLLTEMEGRGEVVRNGEMWAIAS